MVGSYSRVFISNNINYNLRHCEGSTNKTKGMGEKKPSSGRQTVDNTLLMSQEFTHNRYRSAGTFLAH